jgi:hypothetical protein
VEVAVGRQGKLEEALAATEAEAEAAVKAAGAVLRELKRVKAAATVGAVRDLRRGLAAAAEQAEELAARAGRLQASYDVDEAEQLSSGDYTKELLAAAEEADVGLFEEGDRLLCYPSVIRVLPGDLALDIDRKRERRLRPSVVIALLSQAAGAGPKFKPEPLLESLRAAYDLVLAQQGKQRGAVVRVIDVHAVLTLLPGQGRDYGRQEFARDLYLLDQSGLRTTKDGRALRWSASTGTRGGGVLTTVARSGQQQRYWGIAFSAPEGVR